MWLHKCIKHQNSVISLNRAYSDVFDSNMAEQPEESHHS